MRIARAPGRVNLIGDHTDYSGGFVMPVAIQLATTVSLRPRRDRKVVIRSEALDDIIEIDLDRPLYPRQDWSDYVVGVMAVLGENGWPVEPVDVTIESSLPGGAGLGSSAALEVATALALLAESGATVDRLKVAQWCQRAENEFVGARCGIMDQYVTCFGQPGHALLIDCRSLESRQLPLAPDVAIVVCNTMVKHALAASEYNTQRADCELAVDMLRQSLPHVQSLRDVTLDDLVTHRDTLPPTALMRARHVVSENLRVVQAAAALESGDASRFGDLMTASHQSLRDDYEVSCAELDLMVDLASTEAGVFGTRMTGGGFGGCTVSLVERRTAERFMASMQRRYRESTGTQPDAWICVPSGGATDMVL